MAKASLGQKDLPHVLPQGQLVPPRQAHVPTSILIKCEESSGTVCVQVAEAGPPCWADVVSSVVREHRCHCRGAGRLQALQGL